MRRMDLRLIRNRNRYMCNQVNKKHKDHNINIRLTHNTSMEEALNDHPIWEHKNITHNHRIRDLTGNHTPNIL